MHTEKYRGFTIELRKDGEPLNPRKENEHLGVMVCWHRCYKLGDEQPKESAGDYRKGLPTARVELPLYLYDHSGVTIATTPVSCPWDSGQVGFIYVTWDALISSMLNNSKRAPDWDALVIPGYRLEGEDPMTFRQLALAILQSEVDEYNAYLTGDVLCYELKDEHGDLVSSCSGFYPDASSDYSKRWDYLIQQCKEEVDHLLIKA